MRSKIPCVYILTNKRNGTLYTGVTSSLAQRITQHKMKSASGFTSDYGLDKLVYVESCPTMRAAIAREKQLKGGSRKKKIALIESMNPEWKDLSDMI